MKLTAFKFVLPKEQIALYPTKDRDGSRLMVLDRKTGKIEHKKFKNILDYFDEGDTFILNNTKVFPPACGATRRRPAPRSKCSCCAN
jgi:S-adenosylmethionine:tRNA ribosyltransferase-isomerase